MLLPEGKLPNVSSASKTNVNARRTVAALYDFAVHGGAVGDIALRVRIPNGAVIVDSFAHVLTAPTGASATVGVKLQSAGDVFSVAAISGAPWSSTGFKLGKLRYTPGIALGAGNGSDTAIDDTSAGAFLALTAERELTLSIGTAALTAGKINLFIEYVVNATA